MVAEKRFLQTDDGKYYYRCRKVILIGPFWKMDAEQSALPVKSIYIYRDLFLEKNSHSSECKYIPERKMNYISGEIEKC